MCINRQNKMHTLLQCMNHRKRDVGSGMRDSSATRQSMKHSCGEIPPCNMTLRQHNRLINLESKVGYTMMKCMKTNGMQSYQILQHIKMRLLLNDHTLVNIFITLGYNTPQTWKHAGTLI